MSDTDRRHPVYGIRKLVIEAKKPTICGGCGLKRKHGRLRASHETAFEFRYMSASGGYVFVCQQCRTKTVIPVIETQELESCESCGREIPTDLQGSHVCETHPLGLAAEPRSVGGDKI